MAIVKWRILNFIAQTLQKASISRQIEKKVKQIKQEKNKQNPNNSLLKNLWNCGIAALKFDQFSKYFQCKKINKKIQLCLHNHYRLVLNLVPIPIVTRASQRRLLIRFVVSFPLFWLSCTNLNFQMNRRKFSKLKICWYVVCRYFQHI